MSTTPVGWHDPIRASNTPGGTKASPALQAQYDSSTGTPSAPAAPTASGVITDPVTGNQYSKGASGYYEPYTAPSTINSDNTKPNTPITIPQPDKSNPLATNALTLLQGYAGATTTTTANGTTTTAPAPDTGSNATLLGQYLKSLAAPVDTEKIYAKAEQDAGIQEKQMQVNNFTNQLNSITAKAQADKLSLTGQGRGVPEAIIGGQQAEIDKEAAIQALPIAAQLTAAQGDLKAAQDHLTTLFNIRVADAQAQHDYQNKLIDTVYNYATDQQKEALADKRTQNSQDFQMKVNNLNYAQSLATAAISNGQPSVAARLMQLDPNSPTNQQDVASAAKGIHVAQKSADTKAPTTGDVFNLINGFLTPGATIPGSGGVPMLEKGTNFFTKAGFQAAVDTAAANGVKRTDIIEQYAPYLNPGGYANYGLTVQDIANLSNTSKATAPSS